MATPIRDLHVLELSGSVAGSYAAKTFLQHGATVVKYLRVGDPHPGTGEPGTGNVSSTSLYLDAGKQIQAPEAQASDQSASLRRWCEWADIVVESSAPEPLIACAEADEFPHLIRVQISPFGSSGPYRNYRSNEFSDDAMGGQLYLNGEPDREPIARPGLQPHYQAGLHGFIGAIAALRVREETGRGQRVEVSHFEGLASMHQHTIAMWTHGHFVLRREGNRQPGIWHPAGIYPCKDGHVLMILVMDEHRDRFLIAAGMPEVLLDPRFQNDAAVGQNKDAFDEAILPWLLDHTREEILAVAEESRTPPRPVASPLEFLEDPHLSARGYWKDCQGHKVPGRAFSIREFPNGEGSLSAPSLVLDPKAPPSSGSVQTAIDEQPRLAPLEGVRVLDLTRIWAGPLAGRLLADLGADVIVIEAPGSRGASEVPEDLGRIVHCFPDDEVGEKPWNRIGFLNELHRNKRGISLDLKQPEALRLFESLVAEADIVLENFSPRVMAELGLDIKRLQELNPNIIHTAISGYGSAGPHRDWLAFGPVIESSVGTAHGIGYRESGPYRSGVAWADPIAALQAVAATLIALNERECDKGATARSVEVPMIEAMAAVNGERLLDVQRENANPGRRGNRHPERAPQGVYPCAGDDRWIAISIESSEEWLRLCKLADLGEYSGLTTLERHSHHDEIDAALERWSRSFEPKKLEGELQAAGIIAAAVTDARDLCRDEQLSARRFWTRTTHREAGTHSMPGCAIQLSETPVVYRRAAPCLGEHNTAVLQEVLGLEIAEIAGLTESGILRDTPP